MTLPRIYPILDTQSLASKACDAEIVALAWLEGGARIIQFRHKGQWTWEVFDQADRIAGHCRDCGAVFIVNDRADMAKLLDAGLHLGQDDLAPGAVRGLLGNGALLGYSTHNTRQLEIAASEPVDYVAIGPIFSTASKRNPDPVLGLDELRNCRALCRRPLVAIGGITRETAAGLFAAGVDSVAVIAGLLPDFCTRANLRSRMEEWQQLARN